jgi:putative FmdB family regulatory protein
MPTYEYQCPTGHAFEKVHGMQARARVKCPECGKVAHRRISGGAALVFKGSGFYITDYGMDGKGARKPEDQGPKAETAAEKKPATEKPADKAAGRTAEKKAAE